MLKTAMLATAGGFVALPFSATIAFLAVVTAAAAIIAHERRMARDEF